MSGKAEQGGKIVDQKVNRNYSVTFFHLFQHVEPNIQISSPNLCWNFEITLTCHKFFSISIAQFKHFGNSVCLFTI